MTREKDKELKKQKDIESIIDIFDNSEWNELQIKTGDFEIFLSNDPKAHSSFEHQTESGQNVTRSANAQEKPSVLTVNDEEDINQPISVPDGMQAIRAPNLGTFYCQPKPGEPPYVKVGQNIEENSEVCMLEVMKLFTTVQAGYKGTIKEICVNDGDMVEYDQILMIVEPSD